MRSGVGDGRICGLMVCRGILMVRGIGRGVGVGRIKGIGGIGGRGRGGVVDGTLLHIIRIRGVFRLCKYGVMSNG